MKILHVGSYKHVSYKKRCIEKTGKQEKLLDPLDEYLETPLIVRNAPLCNAPPSEPPKEKTVGFPALKGLAKDYKLKVAYVEIIYEETLSRRINQIC